MSKRNQTQREPRIVARVELRDGEMRGALHLYDAVGGWDGIRAKDVVAKLDELVGLGAQNLDIHINSPGGDVFEGMAIHTAIAGWSKGTKTTHIDGLAASIASIVAMAGDEIHIAPTAMVMVHEPKGFAMGEAADLRKVADRLDAIRDVMVGVYTDRTGLAKAEVEKLVAAETWMSADEAVTKGFADKVVKKDDPELDEEDPDEEENEDKARAVALFRNPPERIKNLLHIPLPVAAARPKENAVTFEELKTKLATAEKLAADNQVRAEVAEKASAELMSVTGKANTGEALAMLAGLKENAARAEVLSAQLAKFETEKRTSEIVAIFNGAVKAGCLTPAKRAELERPEAPAFARDPAQLRAFVGCLSPIVPTEPIAAKPIEGDTSAALTPEQVEIAKNFGTDPKVFAAKMAELKTKGLVR